MHKKHVTQENVERLHNKVYGRILSKHNLGSVGQDAYNAKRISYFLNLIKNGVANNSMERAFLDHFMKNTAIYNYSTIQALLSTVPTNPSGKIDIPELGQQLEMSITQIFNRAFNAAATSTGKTSIRNKHFVQRTGSASAGVNILLTADEVAQIKQELGDQILFRTVKDIQGNLRYTFVARAQKSDITVQDMGEINIDASPLLQEFITLIQGSGFSLKNSSHKKGNASISFGYATNYYRAYGAILSYLKIPHNQQGIQALYEGTKESQNLLTHHAHLRFAYEIGGFGQVGKDLKELLTTRYIIINRAGYGGAIAVFSTRDIIQKILKNKNLIRYGSLTLTEQGELKI